MAKIVHAAVELKGTLGGLTYIRSSKYGNHVRAARGTFTKTGCNDVLSKNAGRTGLLNAAMSPVYQFLKTYYSGCTGNELWPEMLRRARLADANDLLSLMLQLEKLELHPRYPFAKPVHNLQLAVQNRQQKILVDFTASFHPVFNYARKANAYYFDIAVLFRDKAGGLAADTISTEWVSYKDEVPAYELVFKKPANACCYLVVMKVQGGCNAEEMNFVDMRGVQVVKVGGC